MSLSEKEVRHVARLAALKLSDEEIAHYQEELNQILSYVDKLSELDTEFVLPTCHVHGAVNEFRKDIAKQSLAVDSIREVAPDFSAEGFRVPKIIS